MAKKSQGLNFEEMQIVLKKLAQFHAASAVHYENVGPYEFKFSRGIYNADMKDVFDQSFEFNFTFLVDNFVSKWPNLDSRIVDKMVGKLTRKLLGLSALTFGLISEQMAASRSGLVNSGDVDEAKPIQRLEPWRRLVGQHSY